MNGGIHRRSLWLRLVVNTRPAGGCQAGKWDIIRLHLERNINQSKITKMCRRQQVAGAPRQLNDISPQTAVISDPRSGVKDSCCVLLHLRPA